MKDNKSVIHSRVLVVDDEKAIRRFLNASLSAEGYEIFEAIDGKEAVESVKSFRPDAIILDLGLPDRDGVDVIRDIRKFSQTPVIVLSVREKENDKIDALDAGADDYLTKPFKTGELLARIRALLRRIARPSDSAVFESGKLTADLSKRIVKVENKEVHLTPTEYEVLKVLVMNAGKVLTHQHVLKHVWGKNPHDFEGLEHLLRVTISNLRNKIESNPDRPALILTEPGVGYRLKAES